MFTYYFFIIENGKEQEYDIYNLMNLSIYEYHTKRGVYPLISAFAVHHE